MKRILSTCIVLCFSFLLVACGGNENSESNSNSKGKGTKDNPYTIDEVVTITTDAWEGSRGSVLTNQSNNRKHLGTNTFELSNFRIEEGTLDSTDVEVLVFDVKCTETCLEDGYRAYDGTLRGGFIIDEFFSKDMQSLPSTKITDLYSGIDNWNRVYFEGTTYTVAYALYDDGNNKERIGNSEDYHLMRITHLDKNDEDQYVYIKLDK